MVATPMLLFADFEPISVKDSRFGAVGDFATDDTTALQAALDHCFGSADAPHGTANLRQNKMIYIPPGHYKISAPLTVKYLHGGRIIGAGRFVTQIENVTPGSSVFATNGCGYSRFEGMRLTVAAGGKSFDLDWDGSAGGTALQSNTFCRHVLRRRLDRRRDRPFRLHGQRDPVSQLLLAVVLDRRIADVEPERPAANCHRWKFSRLQSGDLRGRGLSADGPWCRFQTSADCDIYTGTLSDNAMSVQGCRSESVNFINNAGGQSLHIAGCSHVGASNGYFLAHPGGFCVVSACISNLGNVVPTSWATMRIENSWFKRDWLFLDATHLWWKPNNTRSFCLELENVTAGSIEIRRQRIVTPDGQTLTTSNYTVG
jgi:hypothetical protein